MGAPAWAFSAFGAAVCSPKEQPMQVAWAFPPSPAPHGKFLGKLDSPG